jgi:thiol-disulfide isomerase/thioredoxin
VTRLRIPIFLFFVAAALNTAAEKAPELKLRDLSGKKVRLSDYHGKILVLNFWATWCGPCREEMPMLVEAERSWAAKGVSFIAISLDDNKTQASVPEFIGRYHVAFPVWTGASSDELDKLRLGQGVPDTAFLDEDGIIVARVLGEVSRKELDERLDWLTSDRKSLAPPALVNHM